MARHPPLIGAGFLYGGLAAAYLGAALWLGASLPKSAPGWLSLAFLAVGPGAVAAVSQSYSMPRLGPPTYAIIANCELVTVVVIGVIALGEKLTATRALGGGLTLAGIMLHGGCASRRRIEFSKCLVSRLVGLPPARHINYMVEWPPSSGHGGTVLIHNAVSSVPAASMINSLSQRPAVRTKSAMGEAVRRVGPDHPDPGNKDGGFRGGSPGATTHSRTTRAPFAAAAPAHHRTGGRAAS
jgi:hypothetical protein